MVQAIFQLLLKRLMPASSGIVDGRLKEMYSQQRHVTRRYLLFMPRSSSHISSLCAIQVKIWNLNDGKWKAKSTLATGQPATAVAFTSLKKNKRFVFSRIRTYTRNDMACRRRYLAVGLESGEILIYSALSSSVEDWQLNVKIDSRYAFSFST